jgi:LacI family transcriptional regulator
LPNRRQSTLLMRLKPASRKVSQTQLAAELGISQALVSLVLNGRRQGISPDTYDRIWAHALARGYHPKGMRLASSPARLARQVGFILRAPLRLHTLSSYFSHVQHGLHTALAAQGLTTTFLGSEDLLDREKLARLFPAGHSLRGVVLMGEVSRGFLEELRLAERRLVAISARLPGLCHSVLGNEPRALASLVQHLTDLGHRRIGWLGGNAGLGRHEMRFDAFQAALRAAGLCLDPRFTVVLAEADRAEGGEAIHRLLPLAADPAFPTAFIAYNGLMAEGAVLALRRAGHDVPGVISVAGADFPRRLGSEEREITGAGTDPTLLGEAAARLILTSTGAEDESFSDVILPSQLVVGASTGPVRP